MGRVITLAEFTTDALPARTRYEAWRHLISAVFEPTHPGGQPRLDIRAQCHSANLGSVLISRAIAESQHFTRTPRLIATEGLDHYLLQVYHSGVCDGTYGEVRNTVRPGDIKVIDLTRPFHTLNTDFDNITLTIPRKALAPLLDQPDRMHGMVLRRDTAMARILGAHVKVLSDSATQLAPADGAAVAAATVRLAAACLGANPRAHDEIQPYRAAAIGQVVRDFIEQHLASPLLTPEMLARRFRMSRAQLYRLFAGEDGVAAYIRARRLQRCFMAITDASQSARAIGEIALSLGFNSEAHFSRLFRRSFGVTPSEARAGATTVVPAGPFGRDSFINDWMRALQRAADETFDQMI